MRNLNRAAGEVMQKDQICPGGAGLVFALKRPYCRAVNCGAPPLGFEAGRS